MTKPLPTIDPGRGGWIRVVADEWGGPCWVRFQPFGESERLAIAETVFLPESPLRVSHLRALPIDRLELWANTQEGRSAIFEGLHEDGPDVRSTVAAWRGERDERAQSRYRQALAKRRKRLNVPKGKPYPDSFYEGVARAYAEYALHGSNHPAKDIAGETGANITTVHRWIKEARRRKLMAPSAGKGRMS